MNLPNKLTMGRICAIPVFIVVYLLGYNVAAAIIFIAAAATDALDGHLARSRGLTTNFGKLMDPLADKLLTMAAFLCLVGTGIVPSWMVIVILGREFAVSGLRQLAAADGVVLAAEMTGKIKTVLQMVALAMLILDNWPGRYFGIPLDMIFLWACVIMTIVSGVEYFVKNWKIVVSQGM
ncbi:MAG: CDP-diacylglycerol--glycerol-3-phosphate 3-phosphatidyltransferase [Anaerovoracaceae bacterium]|jgi:CDP-diacylglycerol--glycerol-3-phosphate 3-phosphatidyltransferase